MVNNVKLSLLPEDYVKDQPKVGLVQEIVTDDFKKILRPRYVKEWLACMACGDIIEVDKTGGYFWIADDRRPALAGTRPDALYMMNGILPMLGGKMLKQVADVFRKDGPIGIENSAEVVEFFSNLNTLAKTNHKERLVKDFIPLLGMEEQLRKGIQVLDMGCGEGLRGAREEAKTRNITNVEFVEADAINMDNTWREKFDLILAFDACHDQRRADLAILEIYRCLKQGGLFAMVEVNGTGNCYEDKTLFGSDAAMLYSTSLFHCLPIGSNDKDSLQLGCMWSVDQAKSLLESSGFNPVSIKAKRIPWIHFTAWSISVPSRVLYKAVK
ncbi:methyltransferase domain-containing protein [Ditylenchus destructor]|uniref:Methyltransferase domain-containing protein n=1 Tax=Ditylenchus destructor TaxID=166010 RepID=A0AAD4MXW1_9BILA|nr:methyltransferase domain-containing protein [Ditylenchus destructor]